MRRPLHDPRTVQGARLIARGLAGTGWIALPRRTLEQVLEQHPDELGASELRHYQRATLDEVLYPGERTDALPAGCDRIMSPCRV